MPPYPLIHLRHTSDLENPSLSPKSPPVHQVSSAYLLLKMLFPASFTRLILARPLELLYCLIQEAFPNYSSGWLSCPFSVLTYPPIIIPVSFLTSPWDHVGLEMECCLIHNPPVKNNTTGSRHSVNKKGGKAGRKRRRKEGRKEITGSQIFTCLLSPRVHAWPCDLKGQLVVSRLFLLPVEMQPLPAWVLRD